ncbi:arylamine N-acetyltransferase family protein [Actinokineospora inagensis]|uniref:arylamine N-acetyltransferase family protein n=1 Tax=Actinokineospora inagensis TaxID=103730 RepID=UPI0003FFBC65|nr:arylamine N-acetyltransferase [Actinokineospora inagensis]
MSTGPQQVTEATSDRWAPEDPRRADRPWRRPLDVDLRDAYLKRLGWDAPPAATVETLVALHRANVDLVPYEVVWLALGEERTTEPLDSLRYVIGGRGGYCFHLNGALGCLLDWLGFDVHWRVGGVQGPQFAEPVGANGNHLTLEVHGLPAPESPDGKWLVDIGMGDALYGPLPLVAGEYDQAPFRFRLRPSDVVPGGWRFDHDPSARCPGMDYAPYEAVVGDFAAKHLELTTSPESGFVRVVALCHRGGGKLTTLRGLRLSVVDGDGERVHDIDSPTEYFATLAELFRLPLSDVDDDRRRALYHRLRADHELFLAGRGAQ